MEAEEELRLSERIQKLMAEAEAHPLRDWIHVVRTVVDPEICSRFNIKTRDKHTLLTWHPQLSSLVHYGRHNRARPSILKEGDDFIDVPLVNLKGSPSSIGAVSLSNRPCVVVAGSIT